MGYIELVNNKLIAHASNYKTANRQPSDIKFIVIHYTANDGDSDENNLKYFARTSVNAGAHFFVDDDSISMSVELKDIAKHCGGKVYNDIAQTGGAKFHKICTNSNSIGIEICDNNKNGRYELSAKTKTNLLKLVTALMQEFNIDINHVIRHFDVTGKYCPRYFCKPYGSEEDWLRFKEEIVNYRPILGITPVVKPTYSKEAFIEEIAKAVKKIAPQFGIKVYSPIIAQACLESAYGTSELALNAFNFFGLKWRQNRVPSAVGIYNKVGSEQNADGSYTSSAMQWCKFNSLEDGVRGYFEFISISRYNNLKGVTDPLRYLQLIKEDGYATSLKYMDNVYNVVLKNNLQRFDNGVNNDKDFVNQLLFKCPFTVKVNTPKLNIRTGAGTNFNKIGRYTGIGVFTIVEVKQGAGSKKGWGKLKSGLGWISLDYCEVK